MRLEVASKTFDIHTEHSVFLLAYINGNAELCRLVLKYGVCLAITNNQGDDVFRISSPNTPTKQLLFDLLG